MAVDPILKKLWIQKLYQEYRQIAFIYRFALEVPVIQVEPFIARLGFWEAETRTIILSETLLLEGSWEQVLEVLKHEMAHQWVSEVCGGEENHGPLFKKACEILHVAPWAAKAETDIQLGEETLLEEPQKKLLDRVEKLLALATSSNAFEAQAAMEKAQLLIEKHHLEHLKTPQKNYGYRVISFKKKKSERYQWSIASLLQDHFFVEIIFTSTFDIKTGETHKAIEILGTAEKIKIAEYAYYFLENQIKSLWSDYKNKTQAFAKNRTSFCLGVVNGFREKLSSSEKIRWANTEKSLVALKKSDIHLADYVQKKHPRLHRSSYSNSIGNRMAYESGQTKGRHLTFHHAVETKSNSNRFLGRG